MSKKIFIVCIIFGILAIFYSRFSSSSQQKQLTDQLNLQDDGGITQSLHPLTIESLRKGEYPGSDIVIEQTLDSSSNYQRYIASYKSEGLKIYGLLTLPNGEKPKNGWPVIIFNHGYIPPAQYRTTERYIAYTDAFSRNGYILFRPDYRGHGNSEGQAAGGYGSNAYTIDVLSALASMKKYKDADSNNIGMWGHSMGGFITLRSMVVKKDIKAGVIWGGVVANYPDLINSWRRRSSVTPPPGVRPGWRQSLIKQYGQPEKNPDFWSSISANAFLSEISGPLQLHHGESDTSVPLAFSRKLSDQMKAVNRVVELYTYSGDDHDISGNFGIAMQRSIDFFDKYLKK